jgi:hypothetical protein
MVLSGASAGAARARAQLQTGGNTQERLALGEPNLLRRESKDATERFADKSELQRWAVTEIEAG